MDTAWTASVETLVLQTLFPERPIWNHRVRLGETSGRVGSFEEITASELRPALAAVVLEEATRGLDPDARVVMCYRCPP